MNNYKALIKQFWHTLSISPHLSIVRYLLVGLTNMSVCFLFMYIGAVWLGLHYLAYTVLGYSVAILYSFYMNLRFTFRVSGSITRRLVLFFLISFTNLMIVEFIEYQMISVYGLNHYLAIFTAMVWYAVAGFTMNALLVYRH